MKVIHSDKAPVAVRPYSQGIEVNGLLFFSGMLPINPKASEIEAKDIVGQTTQVLENISELLGSQGLSLKNVVKTTIFLDSIDDFAEVNKVYGTYFSEHKPAPSCVAVQDIPKGALVEIEIIASTLGGA